MVTVVRMDRARRPSRATLVGRLAVAVGIVCVLAVLWVGRQLWTAAVCSSFSVAPAWSSQNRIAFRSVSGLWQIRPDGTDRRRLTGCGSSGSYHSPAWSPDGKQLAVSDETNNIALLSETGMKVRTLPGGADPAWSPDGRLIAFVDASSTYKARVAGDYVPPTSYLSVVRPDGTVRRPIPTRFEFTISHPSWSPDQSELVVYDQNGLLLVQVATGRTRTLGDIGARDPAWSPTGTWIAYARDNGIWLIQPNGTHDHLITHGAPSGEASSPTWSPDGSKIAYVAGDAINIVTENGSRPRLLASTS